MGTGRSLSDDGGGGRDKKALASRLTGLAGEVASEGNNNMWKVLRGGRQGVSELSFLSAA